VVSPRREGLRKDRSKHSSELDRSELAGRKSGGPLSIKTGFEIPPSGSGRRTRTGRRTGTQIDFVSQPGD
jgi:hypothetical protein